MLGPEVSRNSHGSCIQGADRKDRHAEKSIVIKYDKCYKVKAERVSETLIKKGIIWS